jgi:HlyD family secretion protein
VDAWPGRRYEARITRVGYNATDTDGVISYPAVLQVDNTDLSLRPGMTGTADITTLTRDNALLVPNAALRFRPPETTAERASSRGVFTTLMPRPRSTSRRAEAPVVAADGTQTLWVLRDGEALPLPVRTGATNGRFTEIVGGELSAGMDVITEMTVAK